MAVLPGTAATVPIGAAVALLGNDYLLLSVFGISGVAAVVTALTHRSMTGVDQAVPPDPEGVPTGKRAGADFDRLVDGTGRLWSRRGDREAVRERLCEAAVRAVMRTSNCSREDARRRIDRGEWTDDPVAADFLAAGEASDGPFRGRSLSRRARRAVDAIERVDGSDPRGQGSDRHADGGTGT